LIVNILIYDSGKKFNKNTRSFAGYRMTVWIIGIVSVKRISFLNSKKTTNFLLKIKDKLIKSYS